MTAGKEAYQLEKMEVGVLDKRGPTLVIHGNDIVKGAFSKDFTPQSLGATSLNTDLINHAVIPPLALKNGSFQVKIASPNGSNATRKLFNLLSSTRAPKLNIVKANILKAGQSPPRPAINSKMATFRLNSGQISFDPQQTFSIQSKKSARPSTTTGQDFMSLTSNINPRQTFGR